MTLCIRVCMEEKGGSTGMSEERGYSHNLTMSTTNEHQLINYTAFTSSILSVEDVCAGREREAEITTDRKLECALVVSVGANMPSKQALISKQSPGCIPEGLANHLVVYIHTVKYVFSIAWLLGGQCLVC